MRALIYITLILVAATLLTACTKENPNEEIRKVQPRVESENSIEKDVLIDLDFFVISEAQLGSFVIGETVPERLPEYYMSRRFRVNELNEEGVSESYLHNVVFNPVEDLFELIMQKKEDVMHEEKVIEEILVLSNSIKTSKGIRIGSTVDEFIEAYEFTTFWRNNYKNEYFIETIELAGVQFEIDVEGHVFSYDSTEHYTELSTHDLKGNWKIKLIRIY